MLKIQIFGSILFFLMYPVPILMISEWTKKPPKISWEFKVFSFYFFVYIHTVPRIAIQWAHYFFL